jgi:hypothetical protein
MLPAVVESKRSSVVEDELLSVRRDLRVVSGAGPNALSDALAERASFPAPVQFKVSANRLTWLYTSTHSSIWLAPGGLNLGSRGV